MNEGLLANKIDLNDLQQREIDIRALTDLKLRAIKYFQLAKLIYQEFNDRHHCVNYLIQAVDTNLEDISFVRNVAEFSFDIQQWDLVHRLYTFLIDNDDREEHYLYFYRLAITLKKLGEDEEAFSYLVKAYSHKPMNQQILEKLLPLCIERSQWESAQRIAHTLRTQIDETKTNDEVIKLIIIEAKAILFQAQLKIAKNKLQALLYRENPLLKTSSIALEENASKWAEILFEPNLSIEIDPQILDDAAELLYKALQIDESSFFALKCMATISIIKTKWQEAFDLLIRAKNHCECDQERFNLLCSAADIARTQLFEKDQASALYHEAKAIKSHSRFVLAQIDALS